MNRALAWVVVVIAILAVWIDVPKHQFPFPFDCAGVCYTVGGKSTFIEIKTHLGLDLQGGTQLILQLRPDKAQGGTSIPIDQLNAPAKGVIDRRINSPPASEPATESLATGKSRPPPPAASAPAKAQELATPQA